MEEVERGKEAWREEDTIGVSLKVLGLDDTLQLGELSVGRRVRGLRECDLWCVMDSSQPVT